jgi:peptide/nickel transport system permease protein
MWKHILKRLAQAIPLTWGILTITFFISHLAPGDPMDMYIEQQRQRQVDPEIIELLRQKYGLDLPIHIQYVKWLGNVVKGDFGESFRYRRPVLDLIGERIPYTLQLTLLALLFSTSLGIILGIVSAIKQYSALDKGVTLGSLIIYSIPGFWMALMLVLVFSVYLRWLPTSQTRSMDYEFFSLGQKILDRIWHLILPVFVLGVGSAAHKARYVRNRLLEVLNEEYILSARARGLTEKMVIFKHALRNAMIPLVTILGLHLPALLSGSVLIESIFAWPGMGTLAVSAVGGRDYPVMMATLMISAILTIIGSLLADITYVALDPRVSYEKKKPV